MATNKTVTVTVLPTLTGDTVASYNVYEGVSGTTLLGTMSVAEASAGKVFAFTDGIVHSVKTQTVWTTAGASTLRSAGVALDLSAAAGKKLVFTQADGQYAVGTGASIPSGDMMFELDMVTDIGTNNIITYGGIKISRLNATQIYFGIAGGFDIYPLTPAEMAGKNIKLTWNNSTFATSLLVDDVPVTIDSTSGTKADADTTLSMGTFVTQTGGDVEIKGFKTYKATVLHNDYDFDPATETTTLTDKEGNNNQTITVGTGTIGDMWVDL